MKPRLHLGLEALLLALVVTSSTLRAGLVSSNGKCVAYTVPTYDDDANLYSEVFVIAGNGASTRSLGRVRGQRDQVSWIRNDRIVVSDFISADSFAVFDATGKRFPDIVLPSGCHAFYMAVSPDGQKVTFTGSRTMGDKKQYGLFVCYLKSGIVKLLVEEKIRTLAAWSPDSRKLAIGIGEYTQRYPLQIAGIATGKVDDTGVLGVGASWSPDGRLIACTTDVRRGGSWFAGVPMDGKLGIYDVKKRTMRVVEGTDGAMRPTWSKSGSFIAYLTHGKIEIVDRDSGRKAMEQQINRGLLESPIQMGWVGDKVLYMRTGGYLATFDVSQNKFTIIARWEEPKVPDFGFPALTQKQMYEDYDMFTNIVDQVFPLMEVNRQIYGTDIYTLLSEHRQQIRTISKKRTISQTEQFADLINRTIVDCRGSHFWITSLQKTDYYRGFVDDEAYKWADKYVSYLRAVNKGKDIQLPLLYFRGNYYTLCDVACDGMIYPKGMRVLTCNGKAPDEVVNALAESGIFLNWDYDLKKYYTTQFYKFDPWGGTNSVVEMQLERTNGTTVNLKLGPDKNISCPIPQVDRTPLVALVNSNILYIRLPAMDPELIGFYQRELLKYKNQPIRKVVVDIRNNGGGSDDVWNSLLSLLLNKKIVVPERLAVKKSAINQQYLARHPSGKVISESANMEKIGFLNNGQFQVLETTNVISPDTNSLNLDCKVYVLSEHIYSSAGSLMNICKSNSQLISVGVPNDMVLGRGIDPFAFSLPNSKLAFTIEPVLDLADATTARDAHHVDVNVRIEPTLEQLLDYYNTGNDVTLEERLNKHDPFFEKVLKSD